MAHALRKEDLSFADRAPIRITEATVVDAPPDRVWPALADAAAWTEWFAGMKEARYTSPEPHGVGSTRFVHVKMLEVNEEILAFDVDERFAFRVVDTKFAGLAAMVEVVTLEPSGGGTRVVYTQALELQRWFVPMVPLLRRQLRGGLEAGLRGLAQWVEAHGDTA